MRQSLDEILNPGSPSARSLSNDGLYDALAREAFGTRYRYALEAELRRREAWSWPVRLSLALSAIAVIISIVAVVLKAD